MHNERHKLTVRKLFGCDAEIEEEFCTKELNQRLSNLCCKYQNQLKEVYQQSQNHRNPLYTSSFAFRKGKSNPHCGTLYYMVFGTHSLSILNDQKRAMQKKTQQSSELAYSDYFDFRGITVPDGRKTTDEEEAETIFNHFIRFGQLVTLGEVKRFIIEETPYPYHANSLRYLEKSNKLTVENTDSLGNLIERNRKEMCFKVSKNPNDPDWPGQKYGNFWLLRFHHITNFDQDNGIGRTKRNQEKCDSKKQAAKRTKT
jgi:hypothetical protein